MVPNEKASWSVPFVVTGSEATSVDKKGKREKIARRHASVEPSFPVGLCINQRKVVQVRNLLLDERFDNTVKDTEKVLSAICVPVFWVRQPPPEAADSASPGGEVAPEVSKPRKASIVAPRNGSVVASREGSIRPLNRNKSWGAFNSSIGDLATAPGAPESEGEVVAVLKAVNKIDFVRQMAGIPFNKDDAQLCNLFAEYAAKAIDELSQQPVFSLGPRGNSRI